VAFVNFGGYAFVFARGTDSQLWVTEHEPGRDWFPPSSLRGGSITSDPAASNGASNRIYVFARGVDNSLLLSTAIGTPFGFSSLTSLGGVLANGPSAAQNLQSGRVAAFVEGSDTSLWMIEQSTPFSWD